MLGRPNLDYTLTLQKLLICANLVCLLLDILKCQLNRGPKVNEQLEALLVKVNVELYLNALVACHRDQSLQLELPLSHAELDALVKNGNGSHVQSFDFGDHTLSHHGDRREGVFHVVRNYLVTGYSLSLSFCLPRKKKKLGLLFGLFLSLFLTLLA